MRQVELDRGVVGPGRPMHPEVRPEERRAGRAVGLEVRDGQLTSAELVRNISQPPGLSRRHASGIQA